MPLHATIAGRLLGGTSELGPGNQFDTVRGRAPAAADLLDAVGEDRRLLDDGHTRHVHVPELRHATGPDDVETGEVPAMAAAESRGVVWQCHMQNVPCIHGRRFGSPDEPG